MKIIAGEGSNKQTQTHKNLIIRMKSNESRHTGSRVKERERNEKLKKIS